MGTDTDQWPAELLRYLRGTHGELVGVDRLGGWSVAEVWRARFSDGAVVVKATASAVEPAFYRRVAPELRAAGVPIPEIELDLVEGGRNWLVIENLPTPFVSPPLTAWEPDQDITAALARLHAAARGRTFEVPQSRASKWTPTMTASALSLFPSDAALQIGAPLRVHEEQAAVLAEPWCWISGDPSPPNWGRRANGALSLFDWELFRQGVPATDLAITVPGFPSREMFGLAARAYLARPEATGIPWSESQLVDQMCVAKCGTAVAMLAAQATGRARVPEATVAWLVEGMPGWLKSLGAP